MAVVDINEKLSQFSEHWSPKVVARLNDYEIKLVRIMGEFVWHTHPDTDELFLVLEGSLTIQLRDGDVTLGPGQLYVVPRGVEHCPVAEGEVSAMLIEPSGVVNTGDATPGDRTATFDDSLLGRVDQAMVCSATPEARARGVARARKTPGLASLRRLAITHLGRRSRRPARDQHGLGA